eukprot:4448876-Pyramimonas_sp.AAC.1
MVLVRLRVVLVLCLSEPLPSPAWEFARCASDPVVRPPGPSVRNGPPMLSHASMRCRNVILRRRLAAKGWETGV